MSEELPRVTAILQAAGLGPSYSMVPPAVLGRAQARGTAVHAAIEAIHYGFLDEADVPDEVGPYLAAYRRFEKESGHTPVLSEFRVESARWRFCGHPDRVGFLLAKRALLDFKCIDSLDVRPAIYQLAGYGIAWREQHPAEPLDITAVLQLKSDGSYRLHDVDAAAVEHVFLAAVTIWWARKDMERV